MNMSSGNGTAVYKSSCLMCHGGCGILIHVKSGEAVKIQGDPDCPNNRGYLCIKGRAILEYVYHPHRLKYPLKRVGERGSGKWQRISWEEATDLIAGKIKAIQEEHGTEAVATAVGTRLVNVMGTGMLLSRNLGSPNVCGAGLAQCFLPRQLASVHTQGGWLFPDFERGTKLIVMWGAQTHITSPNHYTASRLFYALKKGAKLIVVDPRRTAMAAKADIWQALRPGTDAALLLSWINVIINEDLYDKEFVEKWTNAPFLIRLDNNELLKESDVKEGGDPHTYMVWDAANNSLKRSSESVKPELTGSYQIKNIPCRPVWQELKNRADEYPPERAAKITWVPEGQIRDAARMYATLKPGILICGVAIEHLVGSHQIARAICILRAICNNIDIPGGDVDTRPFPKWDARLGTQKAWNILPHEIQNKILGGETYRLLKESTTAHIPTLKKAILEGKPYPVKALMIWGSNPLICWADTSSTYEVLKKVEFSVACDLFMTSSVQLSDVVLPGASFLEKNRVSVTSSNSNHIHFVPKIIEPLGECRDEFDIVSDIIRKCGYDKHWRWDNIEYFYEEELKNVGLSWYENKYKGWYTGKVQYEKYKTDYYREGGGFNTLTGKVEIFSTKWRELGYEPLPYFRECPETPCSRPDLIDEYPFILITGGKNPMFFHSEFRQIEKLRCKHSDPIVQIHPETAKALGIADGDWVWIETKRGRCKQKAKLFDGMDQRVIHVEHHWWFPEKEQGMPELSGAFESNCNMLTPYEEPFLDPGFGGYNLRGLLCKVYKV